MRFTNKVSVPREISVNSLTTSTSVGKVKRRVFTTTSEMKVSKRSKHISIFKKKEKMNGEMISINTKASGVQ